MNAIAVANEFIDLALQENKEVRLLGLVKLTYLAHGYSLAANDEPLLDYRYDSVEAWRYGPVIPSVYHTFKYHKLQPIKEMAEIPVCDQYGMIERYSTPRVDHDSNAYLIIKFVWNRYKDVKEFDLVRLLHRDGTPWKIYYQEDMNKFIHDETTKLFYSKLIMLLKEKGLWHLT